MGLVLIVVPWSPFWDRNFFSESLPLVKAILSDNFIRGAVSGLGIVNIYAGFAELAAVMGVRRDRTVLSGS